VTAPQSDPSPTLPSAAAPFHELKLHSISLLALILIVAGFLRFDGITRTGLWGDEFQGLFIAAGRGDVVTHLPLNVIIEFPPAVGFQNAPSIAHIWTGLDSTVHPPLYHIVLRLWVDVFGDSDLSIRAMSAVFGLVGIVLLFECVRLLTTPWQGLLAAAMMAFAPVQLDFCQQARPYTLVAALCLVLFLILIRIQTTGSSPLKLILLCLASLAIALTHYFAIGTVLAAMAWILFRFDRNDRWKSTSAIVVGLVLFAGLWGPSFWKTRGLAQSWTHSEFSTIFHLNSFLTYLLDIPQRLTFGPVPGNRWFVLIAMAVLVYLLPLIVRGKNLIWYFWLFGAIAGPVAVDCVTHANSMLIGMDKYVFLAAPAVYAILAAALVGRLVAAVVTLGIAVFGIARFQAGPGFSFGSTLGIEDHRAQARFLADHVQAGDLVILPASWNLGNGINESTFTYFVLAHYKGEWKNPVLLLTEPLREDQAARFGRFGHIWVAGSSQSECERLLAGHPPRDVHETTFSDSVWASK
jgi:hypothetical protein